MEVLDALGGKIYEPGFCEHFSGNEDECAHSFSCSIKPLWRRVQSAIDRALESITIAELLPAPRAVQVALPPDLIERVPAES